MDTLLTYGARERLKERGDVSTRMWTLATHRLNNPGATLKETQEFVDNNMVSETFRGDPVWKDADSAAKYVGGVGATEGSQQMIYDKSVKLGVKSDAKLIESEQYSVLWSEPDGDGEGWRGGIGGGIKAWHEKDQTTGRLTEKIVGYVNF